ncbi:MAG: hypothetical protein J6T74_01515 [Clostridia bacterium]|nr:hypothetical protein [Clostridia bacterium]
MKKIKLLSLIALLGVLFSVMYAGVFAAANSEKTVSLSGSTITIPANIANVRVQGWKGTDTSGAANFDTNSSSTWALGSDSFFNYDLSAVNNNTVPSADKYLTFKITNSGSIPLTAKFQKTSNSAYLTSSPDPIKQISGATVVSATYQNSSGTAVSQVSVGACAANGTATVVTIKLKITLHVVVDTDISDASFSYRLVLSDAS